MMRVFGYGGGWQSNAALVLAAQGKLSYRTFLFADVGEDSEKDETVSYVKEIARPYAEANGLDLITVRRQWADGREFESILQKIENCPDGVLREPIPVRGENGMPLSRSCTADWKVAVTGRWCREHGATPENKTLYALGYTMDEISRVNPARAQPHEQLCYPLMSLHDDTGLHLRRSDCPAIITGAGLPLPEPSSCWFCPNKRPESWQRERREHPERFQRSVALERKMNARRTALGKRAVYFTRFGMPLDQAIPDGVDLLPLADGDWACDTGGCFT